MADPLFPPTPIDPQLVSLITDMAVIKSVTSDTNRRLEELQSLSRVILETKAQSDTSERRLDVVETRIETIDRHVDAIAQHDMRLKELEKDIIQNGELRISNLERLRTAIVGGALTLIGSASLWFAGTFLAKPITEVIKLIL